MPSRTTTRALGEAGRERRASQHILNPGKMAAETRSSQPPTADHSPLLLDGALPGSVREAAWDNLTATLTIPELSRGPYPTIRLRRAR
jgi:hypothetical protein